MGGLVRQTVSMVLQGWRGFGQRDKDDCMHVEGSVYQCLSSRNMYCNTTAACPISLSADDGASVTVLYT